MVNDADGVPVETYSEKVKPPEPIHYGGGTEDQPTSAFLERVACCHCSALCLEGHRACFECGGPVKPGSLKSQARRTALARGREALIDQTSLQRITTKVKSASKDVAGRGMASFEG